MTNTAAASHTIARLAIIVLGAIAFMLGLSAISEAQAAPTAAPIIEAGIPEDHECVLRTADGTPFRVVADTDPRCKVQGQEGAAAPIAPADCDTDACLGALDPAGYGADKSAANYTQATRTIVVVPELATIATTPVVCRIEQGPADGAFRWETCTPEESPRGGYVTVIDEGGSASYSDGYTIAPAKTVSASTTGAVLGKWKAPSTV